MEPLSGGSGIENRVKKPEKKKKKMNGEGKMRNEFAEWHVAWLAK